MNSVFATVDPLNQFVDTGMSLCREACRRLIGFLVNGERGFSSEANRFSNRSFLRLPTVTCNWMKEKRYKLEIEESYFHH